MAATPASSPWSGKIGPVPHAFTSAAPALAHVTFGASPTVNTVVAWKGQTSDKVYYESSPDLGTAKDWTARAQIPGATTGSAPAIASYRDPNGHEALVAVWRAAHNHIDYAQGEATASHTFAWTKPASLPRPAADLNTTDAAPAVFFPAHRYAAVIAFRGPHEHIRTIVGIPARRGFNWKTSRWISSTAIAATGPTLAEVSTGTAKGTVYAFWKDKASTNVSFSTVADPLNLTHGIPAWTTVTVLAGSQTSEAPAASSVGPHGTGPLLLAYKAPHSANTLYRTLAGSTWSAAAVVPGAPTTVAPALLGNTLATTSATSAGNIFFHTFS